MLDDREDYGEDRYILTGTAEGVVLVVFYFETNGQIRIISARRATKHEQDDTFSKTTDRPLRAMTPEEVEAAANSDPDNRPLSPADLGRMRRTPQVKVIRRALGISQEDFAARFHIPIGTLRDWEQGRVAPDQAARA